MIANLGTLSGMLPIDISSLASCNISLVDGSELRLATDGIPKSIDMDKMIYIHHSFNIELADNYSLSLLSLFFLYDVLQYHYSYCYLLQLIMKWSHCTATH
jgi:hypothetical protein